MDLDLLISTRAAMDKIHAFILDLFLNTIIMPVREFHNTVTQQEQLARIKRVTARTTMESTAAKVIAKIQAEEPADRPLLQGLIRKETNNEVSHMKQQLQSALDSIATNSKKLKTLTEQQAKTAKLSQRGTTEGAPTQLSTTGSKNMYGGNRIWSRNPTAQVRNSTVAAEYSSTTQPYRAPHYNNHYSPTSHTPQAQNYNAWHAETTVVRNTSTAPPPPSIQRSTPTTAVGNASAAERRKKNKRRALNKSNGRNNN